MPIYKNPKTEQEYELDADFDVATGVDRNREKALAKGYVPVVEVVNPKTSQAYSVPDTELGKATDKGYQIPVLAQAEKEMKPYEAAGVDQYGDVSPSEAAIRGLTSAIPFTDEAAGAVVSPMGALKSAAGYITGNEASGPDVEAFQQERDLQRARNELASQDQPAAFYPAMGVGALATGGAGTSKTIAGKIASGAAEGAMLGVGASEGATIQEDIPNIATGAAIGALPGVAEAAMGASRAGVKLVAGPESEQFLGNQALLETARDRTAIPTLKDRLMGQSRVAKEQIKGDIAGLKESSSQQYNALKDRLLNKETAPLDLANDPIRKARDIFAETQKARQILPDDKQMLDDILMGASSNEKRAVQLSDMGGVLDERAVMGSNASLTQGEALDSVIQMKQELGNQINALTMMQKAGNLRPSENNSLQLLKEAQAKLNGIIDETATTMSPELSDAYKSANQGYREFSNLKATAKDAMGAKKVNSDRTMLSENKLRRLVETGDEDVRNALKSRLSPAASGKVEAMGETISTMKQTKAVQDDWNLIKNKVPLEGIPGVSKVIKPSNAILMYNKLSPALKASIKALEQSGKPITLGVIEALAKQHKERVENIQAALGN